MNKKLLIIVLTTVSSVSLLQGMQQKKGWSEWLNILNPWGNYSTKRSLDTQYIKTIQGYKHIEIPIGLFLEKDQEIQLKLEKQDRELLSCRTKKEQERTKVQIARLKLRRHNLLNMANRIGYDAKIAKDGRLLVTKKNVR